MDAWSPRAAGDAPGRAGAGGRGGGRVLGRRVRGAVGRRVGVGVGGAASASGSASASGPSSEDVAPTGGGESITVYSGQHQQTVTALADATSATAPASGSPCARAPRASSPTRSSRRAPTRRRTSSTRATRRRWRRSSEQRAAGAGRRRTRSPQVPRATAAPDGDWVGRLGALVGAGLQPRPGHAGDSSRPRCSTWPSRSGRAASASRRPRPTSSRWSPRSIAEDGEEAAKQWLEGLKANGTIYDDNEAIIAAVNRGEIAAGLIEHYYWYRLRDEVGADDLHAALHYFPARRPGRASLAVSGRRSPESSEHAEAAQALPRLPGQPPARRSSPPASSYEYPLRPGVTNPSLTAPARRSCSRRRSASSSSATASRRSRCCRRSGCSDRRPRPMRRRRRGPALASAALRRAAGLALLPLAFILQQVQRGRLVARPGACSARPRVGELLVEHRPAHRHGHGRSACVVGPRRGVVRRAHRRAVAAHARRAARAAARGARVRQRLRLGLDRPRAARLLGGRARHDAVALPARLPAARRRCCAPATRPSRRRRALLGRGPWRTFAARHRCPGCASPLLGGGLRDRAAPAGRVRRLRDPALPHLHHRDLQRPTSSASTPRAPRCCRWCSW